MKAFIVLALFAAVAVAIPVDPKDAVITDYNVDNIGVGPFNTFYRTSDGTSFSAEGTLKNVGTENEAAEVRGQYSFTAPDGVVYTVTYTANEFGYQASGDHLPKAPQ